MPTIEEMKQAAIAAIEERKEEIIGVARTILQNPETGFTEQKTSRLVQQKFGEMGIPFQGGLAITGVKGMVQGKAGPGPTVAVFGELDSLRVLEHPFHDDVTGAAHACGHHCQVANMMGAMVGVMAPGVIDHLSGRIAPIAVPAEEFIEVERRMRLRDEGKIEFMGGKQEFIKLGVFDDVDMAMISHTSSEQFKLGIGGTSNGHVVKFVQFTGRGAHAGGAPHMGLNALNAAMIALSAINANRETFRDQDTVRVHGILTRGGDAVSAVPSNVTLEWRVRSGNLDALVGNSGKVDRCFRAGALAVGAQLSITNIPGYLPMRNNAIMQELYTRNARELVGEDAVLVRPATHNGGGSTDMGDLAQIMPLIHPYCGGATGTGHGADYVIKDYDTAVIAAAKAMAMTVIDLLADGAQKAREVKATDRPPMTREQYLKFQRERAEVVRFDGANG
ncbi:MAG: peptidase dimerization domain-containing protein [Chloroflexi bacterium]|nr:peptidase dimerization domain-containing protein [Chloroflexota bacterium]